MNSIQTDINRKHKSKLLFSYIILILSVLLYIVGELSYSYQVIQYALVLIMLFFILKYGNRENATIFAFIICFCMFLLNRIFISMISPNTEIAFQDNISIMMHLHRCLYIAMIFILMGVVRLPGKTVKITNIVSISENKNTIYIQQASKILFYVTCVFRCLELIEKAFYVIRVGGYLSYYTSFSSSLPVFVKKLAELNEILFFIFLATMPDPRKHKMPFVIFVFYGFLTLLYGQRNGIVTSVIIVVVYIIIFENTKDIKYSIIPKQYYYIAFAFIPLVFLGLNAITYIRSGTGVASTGVMASIENFLSNIGNSIRVIIYGKVYGDQIGHHTLYSFGSLTSFFRNNVITNLFFGASPSAASSVQLEDFALNGFAFSNAVTYFYSRSAYLSGHGLGSCYIAEAYHDFGYVGICFFSFIYGKIVKNVPNILGRGWIFNSIVLLSFYSLLLTPRDTACQFLACFINLQFILCVVFVYFLSSLLQRRNSNENN